MDPACTFEGNNDVYGLGVRVGIYLQWLTTIFAIHLYHPAVESVRNANTTFQLAMFTGLILLTQNVPVKAIEGYIALLFCLATACIGTLLVAVDMYPNGSECWRARGSNRKAAAVQGNGQVIPLHVLSAGTQQQQQQQNPEQLQPQRYRPPRPRGEQRARGLGDLILSLGVCVYGVWLVFVGLDHLPRVDEPDRCPELAFLFAHVHLFDWFRTLLKVVLILALIVGLALTVGRSWSMVQDLRALLAAFDKPQRVSPRPTMVVQNIDISALGLVLCLGALVLFIVGMEMMLRWNGATDVNAADSFSQLFPLVVGGANLARVMYQAARTRFFGNIKWQWSWW